MTLYQKLKATATSNPDLLVSGKNDLLVHDRRAIRGMRTGEQWLWVLRRYGTLFYPVAAGQHPDWVIASLKEAGSKAFLVTITADGRDGEIQEVSVDRAVELARMPAPKGRICLQPGIGEATLHLDGAPIGNVRSVNGMKIVTIGWELLGRFASWALAEKAITDRFGPLAPTVKA